MNGGPIYNWQQPEWPEFRFDLREVEGLLLAFAEETGIVSGMLQTLSGSVQMEAIIEVMVAEAVKTSEIEGEYLSRPDVVSSIRHHLGIEASHRGRDKKALGVGRLMVDLRNSFAEPLNAEKLFEWHRMLMADTRNMTIGQWRFHDKPMQVVSGALGKERVHFEAPPSAKVPMEMERFLLWFNETAPGGKREMKNAPLRSAIAHLYFETIHPFEDGNGRIGRAIAEKALSQTLGRPVLLSLSRTIEVNRKAYYQSLEKAQRSNEITEWIGYFAGVALDAQRQARQSVHFLVRKARFFDRFKDKLNERQLKVIRKMMDAGPEGFKGGMSAAKYISITGASKATATRDLQYLFAIGALTLSGGGRSTRYQLQTEINESSQGITIPFLSVNTGGNYSS
jgi:Fic family protein